jgi:hypothetical protein
MKEEGWLPCLVLQRLAFEFWNRGFEGEERLEGRIVPEERRKEGGGISELKGRRR